ncbi:MAG: UPF0182 family protein, partial [Actinomycetes bacterium]
MSSFQFPGNPFSQNPGSGLPRRKLGPAGLTAIVFAILVIIFLSLSSFYADLLWFRSVAFASVWKTTLVTKIELFIIFGLASSLFITAFVIFAYRTRPIYAPTEVDNLERYRGQIEPIRKTVIAAIAIGIFYFAGSSGSGLWQTWLQFKNATSFGVKDAQFGKDISFYAFKLPMYQSLLSWGISLVILTLLISAGVHYLY